MEEERDTWALGRKTNTEVKKGKWSPYDDKHSSKMASLAYVL